MSKPGKAFRQTFRKAVVYGALGSFIATSSQPLFAAQTQIGSGPIASTTSAQVKPNIMLLMDNSGSMAWEFMPDNVDDSSGNSKIGFKHFRCNTMYYNPAISYALPKKPDGSNFPTPSFSGAYSNGFQNYPSAATSTTNLSTSFTSSSSDTAQAAYYYTYSGTQTLVPSTTGACRDTDPNSTGTYGTNIAASGGGNWVKVQVSASSGPGSTDERQNFANWYSYYHTRILMMKSAASRAFYQLSDSYRLGFIALNNNTTGYDYLKIADLSTTQKASWFQTLFKQAVGSSTPLREGLSQVGRHYAGVTGGINSGYPDDPVQYSCQQNFTIAVTDGYWNGNAGQKIDGTAIGNHDNDLSVTPRPMWDGGTTGTTTVTDKSNAYQYAACSGTQTQQRTIQNQRTTVQNQKRTIQNQRRTLTNYTVTYSQLQQRTPATFTRTYNQLQRRTPATYTVTYNQLQRCVPPLIYNSVGPTCSGAWTNVSSCSSACRTTTGNTTTAASCTVGGAQGTGGTITACAGATWGAWSNIATCTPSSTLQCQTTTGNTTTATTCTVGGAQGTGGTITACAVSTWGAWSNTAACTPSSTLQCQTTTGNTTTAASCTVGGSIGTGGTITACAQNWGAWSNIGTCTPSSTVQCQVASDSGWVNIGTCTASNPAAGPTVTCQAGTPVTTSVGTCTASNPAAGPTVTCAVASDSGWVNVATCTASNPAAGPTVTCQNVTLAGQKIQWRTTTTTTTTSTSGGISTGPPVTVVSPVSAWSDLDGTCYTVGLPSLPASGRPGPTLPPALTSPCTAWPCTTTSTTPAGGSSGTLADVAQYYYMNDLRPTMTDNVPATGQGPEDDKAPWQHMTTFTMGLGLTGTIPYRSDYKIATTGSFQQIRDGTLNWPAPAADAPTALDDLWHAAVNGRGLFFSAADPDAVVSGLLTALAGINARVASAAAAATSNLEPVAGDNFAYTAKYKTVAWTGELEAHKIDLTTGAVLPTVEWSAQGQLDLKRGNACDNRKIYLFHSGATDNRVNFTSNTYACDTATPPAPTGSADTGLDATEMLNFDSTKIALLSQYPSMTDGTGTPATANQRGAAPGSNLVNFLRGQKGKEGFVSDNINSLYRTRENVFGDVVNAQPVYVKAPFAAYKDTGYTDFKTKPVSQGGASDRAQVVYVAANDGMLHAFDAVLGGELWAFIPTMVLPNMYKLADNNYANNHVYLVDGTPSVGDAYDTTVTPAVWKTILVAGLNAGGKGYYALDITDPASPKGLWEFKWSSTCHAATTTGAMAAGATSDCHIGYTFNNPLITKLSDGRWVVIVTSGYNNVNAPPVSGDGQGYLYVLNAFTGEIIYKIATSAGDATTPSGLNHTNNWVDKTLVDNTTVRVYGVDILGNIWRFDVNDSIVPGPGREATLIGTAKDPSGNAQSITTRPELAEVGPNPYVFVATGRLLGTSDITDTQVHSIYGIRDPLTGTTGYANLRAALKPLTMTQVGTGATATRTIDCTGTTTECNSANGWVANLPESGERVNVDMKLQLSTLVVASNVPENSACTIGGHSWLNYLNFSTGTAVANSPGNSVGQYLSDSLAVGLNIVRLPTGKTVVITTTSDAKQTTVAAPFDIPAPTGKRISWREISQ